MRMVKFTRSVFAGPGRPQETSEVWVNPEAVAVVEPVNDRGPTFTGSRITTTQEHFIVVAEKPEAVVNLLVAK